MFPDLFAWPWFSWLIATLLIVLGISLCFKGRQFLKPLLGILGAGVGAMAGVRIADQLAVNVKLLFADPRLHYVFVTGLTSAICAVVSVLVWKAALALLTGFLGYAVATTLEGVAVIAKIIHESDCFYFGFYGIAILLPMSLLFLPDRWLVPVVSGAVGSAMAVIGLDVFVDTGLLSVLMQSMKSMRVPEEDSLSEAVLMMACAWILISAAGTVYQMFDADGEEEEDGRQMLIKQHVYFDDI